MNGAFLANRFPVAEPTAIQPDNGIREQFPTLRTKLPVPFPVDTVKTDHPLDDPLLIVYPPPRKNHTSDLTITQLAANQLSTNLEYGTVQKRSLPPYPFPKPPGHLAIPPYQSILYKYNQIVRIFVFYPDAVYSRLREIPPRRITCYFRNGNRHGPVPKERFRPTENSFIPDRMQYTRHRTALKILVTFTIIFHLDPNT